MKQRIIRGFSVLLYLSAIFSGQLIFSAVAHAAIKTWSGSAGDFDWQTASNWVGGSAPVSTDTVSFPKGSLVHLTTNVTVAGITCQNVALPGTSNNSVSISELSPMNLSISGPVVVEAGVNCGFFTSTVTVAAATLPITLTDVQSKVDFSNTLVLGSNAVGVSSPISVSSSSNSSDLPSISIGTVTGTSGSVLSLNKSRVYAGSLSNTTGFLGRIDAVDSQIDFSTTIPAFRNLAVINMTRSQMYFADLSSTTTMTFPTPLNITGNFFGNTGDAVGFNYRAITVHDFTDAVPFTPAATFSGAINLNSDISVGAGSSSSSSLAFTGAITGNYILGWSGVTDDSSRLIINSSSNGSKIPNGTYKNILGTVVTYADSVPSENLIINIATVSVNGQRGNIVVTGSGILKGTGNVGTVLITAGGKLAPGNSPGCLNTGNLSISTGSSLDAEVTGTVVCSGYDQTKVTGTVTLTSPTLNLLVSGFSPAAGNVFTIIDNDGNDAVVGTFNGLAEGATFVLGSVNYKISYVGGDGNDVVVSVVGAVPKTPNTGFADITSQKLMVGGLMVTVAGLLIAKKSSKLLVRTK